MATFEYAPAPESRAVVDLKPSYGLFINGEFTDSEGGSTFKSISPATEEVLAEVTSASEADVDRAVAAARRAYTGVWGRMSGADRGKYLFRIARILQERAREFAVLESLDNGKPIKESRDVDVPLAAAHFFYHAGWADKLEYAGLGTVGAQPRPHGVVGQVIPWNFPLLMLAWKIAPALATGNTVVIKPAETTPLSALLFAEVLQQADLPPGVVNIVTGAGATGQAIVDHPGIDKLAFTGSTGVGKMIARSIAGTRKKATLELGGKAANIVFDDAPLDQAVEGIVNGIFFNQGHVCCAGSRLLVQETIADEVEKRLKRRLATLRVGDPLDKNTDVGAINSKAQLDRITELTAAGEAEGAQRWDTELRAAGEGLLVPPDRLHRRQPDPPHRPGGDLRAGPVGADLPHPPRGRRQGQQHALRAVGRRLDREGLAHPVDGRPAPGRSGVGQHLQQVRPDQPVRWLQGVRLRPRGWPSRPVRLRHDWRRQVTPTASTADSRVDVRKTYKLYIGGKFPRSESGRSYEVFSAGRSPQFLANAAMGSRKDARDAVVAARAAFAGWAGATAYNRGQVLYRVAEVMEGRRAQFVAEVRASEGLTEARADAVVSAAIDRWVWYAGWTDKLAQILGGLNPVAGPYFDISAPEPTGVVGVLAPQGSSLLGLVSVRGTGDRVGQHRRGPHQRAPTAAGDHAVRGAGDLRRARWRRQHHHRAHRRGGPVDRLPPRRQRHRPDRCRRRRRPRLGRPRARRRREPQAGPAPGGQRHRRRRAGLGGDPRPVPRHGLPRDQDGLAPQGPLTRVQPPAGSR